MSRNSLKNKPSNRLNLKKALIYTAVAGTSLSFLAYIIIGFIGTAGISYTAKAIPTPGSGPVISGYSYSQEIQVDHSKVMDTIDMIDFPLMVKITHPELKSVINGGNVQSDDGYDIVFSGANDSQLDHQIESYDPTTGEYVAWVRLPVLYANVNTEFKVSYGNAAIISDPSTENVWSANYEGVWHMSMDPSTSLQNDYSGNLEAESFGSMTSANLVPGKIGKAIDFDGNNDRFAIQNKFYSQNGEIATLSVAAWVKTTYNHSAFNKNWSIIDFDRSENFNVYVHGNGKASFSTRGSTNGINDFHAGNAGQLNDGNWHMIVAVYDGYDKHIYIDGVLEATKVNPHQGNPLGRGNVTRYGYIGDGSESSTYNGNRNNRHYEGQIDEIQFLSVDLTAGWISTMFNNQSAPETFIIFAGGGPLPVSLTSFNATMMEEEVLVNWEVASQINNDYFTVERSEDGENYDEIGTVYGAGNSSEAMQYSFVDEEPIPGISYYRLRQTDYDGQYEVFTPVAVEYKVITGDVAIESFGPNPFHERVRFSFSSDTEGMAEVIITNMNGQQVHYEQIRLIDGYTDYTFNQGYNLKPGTYLVNIIQDGERKASAKLLKK